MNKIELNNFNESSFVHASVLSSVLDITNKSFIIDTDYALLDNGENLLQSKIVVNDWYEVHVIERRNNIATTLSSLPEQFLTSIIEFYCSETELRLIGLGYNCWLEWVFLKPKVAIYGELDVDKIK